jgi:hypothetical protein
MSALESFRSRGAGTQINVPRVNLPGVVDTSGARSAAFGRAKEQVGDITSSALQSLENLTASRGFADAPAGGAEGALQADILSSGARDLSEVPRDQAIEDARRSAQVEDRNLAAALTQRGQDIGVQSFNARQKDAAQQQLLRLVGSLF